MTPVTTRLTPDEQAAHYVRLVAAGLDLLDRHALSIPARRMLAEVEPAAFDPAPTERLMKFAARLRSHGHIINGVHIGPHFHRWADPERPPSPDGDALIELANDLGRVLTATPPRH